jgi:hypothetical protein
MSIFNHRQTRPTAAYTPTRRFAPQRTIIQGSRGFHLVAGFKPTAAPSE